MTKKAQQWAKEHQQSPATALVKVLLHKNPAPGAEECKRDTER